MTELELTRSQLSVALGGLGTRQIQNLEQDEMPTIAKKNRKTYPLAAVPWYWRKKLNEEREKREASAMEEAKLRKLEAEAELKELDVAVRRGELVPMDDVEDLVREALESVNAVIRHSPSRIAPRLAKAAGISVKKARTHLEDMVELVRGAVRGGEE